MNIISIINLFGGVGLFLFGMSLMGSSLQKLAGGSLEKILETLTTSKKKGVGAIKGWGLGVGVTGVIQSSAATTLMLIGFVNAGIMKLSQTIPVVFGANVGSTFTAQILRLGDLGSGSIIFQLLKPSSFAPMLLALGMLIVIVLRKQNKQKSPDSQKVMDITGIMIGLGLLFYGMTMMEEVFEPLKDSPAFQKLFISFSNPLIGILTGIILTAIIQSSSAAVGILQALSASGSVTYGIALPFILGQNIGKCMPIILGAIGATKKAKRVSISYILFNVFSTLIFAILIYGTHLTVGLPILEKSVNRGNIANVHLMINLITSLILLPFCNHVSSLSSKLTGDSDEDPDDEELKKLDDRILGTPGIALHQCINIINKMGERILENYNLSTGLLSKYDENAFTTLEANEAFLDKCETTLSAYIIRIDRKRLTPDNRLVVSEILHSIGDFERIGDYCMNIAYAAKDNNSNNVIFSEAGINELNSMILATKHTLETLIDAFINDNGSRAARVEPLAHTINNIKELSKSYHVDRLQRGDCTVEAGVALFDLNASFERIASHCSNIALHIIKRTSGDNSFDEMHGHTKDYGNEEYKALENYYYSMYIEPIVKRRKTHKTDISDDKKNINSSTTHKEEITKKKKDNAQKKDNKNKDNSQKENSKNKDNSQKEDNMNKNNTQKENNKNKDNSQKEDSKNKINKKTNDKKSKKSKKQRGGK